MKVTWANLHAGSGENLLDLLHLEADGDLDSAQQALLDSVQHDPEVQAARTALRRAVTLLSGPNPPLPRSVASVVAAEVSLAQQLQAPALQMSVAAAVSADIFTAQCLKEAPALPKSVAAAVSAEIGLAQALPRPPRIPASVAAAVTADIQAAQWLPAPPMPRSVAPALLAELQVAQMLAAPAPVPPLPSSVAAAVAARIVSESPSERERAAPAGPLSSGPVSSGPVQSSPLPRPVLSAPSSAGRAVLAFQAEKALSQAALAPSAGFLPAVPRGFAGPNPAPVLLVMALLVGLTLLAATTAWPNLAAGVTVLRALFAQVSPLAGLGLAVLLLTSLIVTWKPTPALRTAGAGAFALSAVLTIPALYNVAGGAGGLSIGRNVTVSGPVKGNVIAIGGNIHLNPQARVQGEVVTLLGDVHREPGAQVGGRVNALLGHAPGDREAIETLPVTGPSLAMAAAFRPVLGWLGAAAWPQIFVALTGGLLLLLFLGGTAPVLAQRQRHAPMRTLALGVLLLAALTLPAAGFGLVGLLGPALLTTGLTALLIATGLSVSVYDAGRALAYRLKLPVPDAVGAMIGLCTFAASLSLPPLAFALALIGGTWGAGTLFLTRRLRPAA